MQLEEFDVMGDAIQTFGERTQQIKAVEEMSELTKELCKHLAGADNVLQIAEEIADVRVMMDQLEMIFCCGGRVKAIRASKLRRLEERVREHTASRGPHPAQAPPSPCGGKAKGAEP